MTLLAVDSEATGLDLRHGARPYIITTCDQDDNQITWVWDVDPLTRQPVIPASDLEDIRVLLFGLGQEESPELVLHNTKFDATALATVMEAEEGITLEWPWERNWDSLLAAHLLGSNHQKDLTSQVMMWLGRNIQEYEDRLEVACKEARRYAKKELPSWRLAKFGEPDMPSIKKSSTSKEDKPWKADAWLPRTLIQHGHCLEHKDTWLDVAVDYANMDSAWTVRLWPVQMEEIKRRGLWEIYLERRKLLPIAYRMERNGVVASRPRLEELKARYETGVSQARSKCVAIASKLKYDLDMPKSGNNDSLLQFCFGVPDDKKYPTKYDHYLELPISNDYLTDSGNPSLAAEALDHYKATLDGDQLDFVNALSATRGQGKAIEALEGYERFWLPLVNEEERAYAEGLGAPEIPSRDWMLLYTNMNMTGPGTLRWSSSNPNLQNISKKRDFNLRYVFGPEEGREHWSLDFKNVELRIPAYESGEQALIDLFEKSDEPPFYGSEHLLNFSVVYHDIWNKELRRVGLDKVGPTVKKDYESTEYKWTKNGDFAIGYGAGRATTDLAFHRAGAHDLLKSRFTKKERLNQHHIQFAKRHGYVETIPDKTVNPKKGYPLLCTRTEYGDILPTVPLNYHVQGSAMWGTGKAMVRCQGIIDQWNREAGSELYKIALQVHDELFFDFPKKAHPKVTPRKSNLARVRILQQAMELSGNDFGIPLPVSVEYHENNWSVGVTL